MLMVFVEETPLMALKTISVVAVSLVMTVTFTAPDTPEELRALAREAQEVKFVADAVAPELRV